jgi:hypothetical protein
MNVPNSQKYIFSNIIYGGIPNELVDRYVKYVEDNLLTNLVFNTSVDSFLLQNIKGFNKSDHSKLQKATSQFCAKLRKLGWSKFNYTINWYYPFNPEDEFKLYIFRTTYGK